MSSDHPETEASMTIGAISYRARCTENQGRLLFICADAGDRPINHLAL
jgi:hypothetical protein